MNGVRAELSLEDKIVSVSEGNPGCLSVLMMFARSIPEIVEYIYLHGPYGSDVWILWKDWCGEDMEVFTRVIGLLMQMKAPDLHHELTARVESKTFFSAWERFDANA